MEVKKTITDYDLIEMFQDEHEAFAKEAFSDFYNKHSSFIFNSCYSLVVNNQHVYDTKSEAEDLSHTVIEKIYNGTTFKRKNSISENEIQFHVRGWIYRIIQNTFKDEYIKKVERRPQIIRIEKETQDEIEFNYINKQSEKKTALSKEDKEKYEMILSAMSEINLSDKEIDVFRVYIESGWHDDRNNFNLPSERMQELTDKYKVKKNSIIQCKNRVIKKIKAKLEQKQTK